MSDRYMQYTRSQDIPMLSNEINHETITRTHCLSLYQINRNLLDYPKFKDLYLEKVKESAGSGVRFWGSFYIRLQQIFVEVAALEDEYHRIREEDAAMEAYQEMCDSGEAYYRSVTPPEMWGQF